MGGFWAPSYAPYLDEGTLLAAVRTLLSYAFWASMLYVLARATIMRLRPAHGRGHALIAGWFVLPLVAFVPRSYPLIFHYMFSLTPALFAVLGIGFAALTRVPVGQRLLFGAVALFVSVLVLSQSWALARFLRWIDTENLTETYGVPVKYSAHAADTAKVLSPERQVYLVGHGDNVDIFAFHFWGHHGIKPLDDRSALVVPRQSQDVVYVVPDPIASQAQGVAAFFLAESFTPTRTITYPGTEKGFRVYQLGGDSVRQALIAGLTPLDVTLSNGVTLRGGRLVADVNHKTVTLLLGWEVTAAQDGAQANQRFFNHLIEGNGRQVAQWDGIGYPGWAWEPGDVVLSWHQISLPDAAPSGEYRVRLGMYDSVTLMRTELRINGQRPPEDDVTVGTVTITRG
jgi:hypothetical protein